MLSYLLVALGGAIGSVARYAVSVAFGNLWGDAFPWGTIIVNITGCLVIGYVASLTLPEGPTPASPALRLFIMVGICGGYTTFSSFSLQTLTLMQGGAWLGALGNVVISVVCCIVAVVLGFVAGQRSGVLFHQEASAAALSILAILNRPETAHPVLAVAGCLSARMGGKRIDVLHVRHDGADAFMPFGEMQRQAIGEGPDERAAALRAAFDARPRPDGAGRAVWREAVGATRTIVSGECMHGRLVVLGRAHGDYYEVAERALSGALIDSKAPVVLVPETAAALGRHVGVAWKAGDALESAVAVAMPILLKAERVSILIGAEAGHQDSLPNALLDRLAKHGVPVEVVRFELGGRTIGAALQAEARARGVDLLVMGAFTHSRIEEAIFGGATREIIANPLLPVLLHH